MIKTITLEGGKELRLSNNVGWLLVYKDQFGQDIVPSLIPVLNAGIDLVFNVYQATGGEVNARTILSLDPSEVESAIYKLSAFEAVDLLNIVWAMAKNADESLPEPRKWLNQFETFPLDEIAPAVFDLLYRGMISSKNSTRLQEFAKSLKPEA